MTVVFDHIEDVVKLDERRQKIIVLISCSLILALERREGFHFYTRTDLMDSGDLALNAVVLDAGATRPLVPRHVDTHHMLASGEVLEEKTVF